MGRFCQLNRLFFTFLNGIFIQESCKIYDPILFYFVQTFYGRGPRESLWHDIVSIVVFISSSVRIYFQDLALIANK